jgi:thiol-disulfide isomerase/thioredoxin
VRIVVCVTGLAVCLALAGCTTFGKKAGSSNPPNRSAADRGLVTPNDRLGALPPDKPGATAGLNGILAGQILDSYNQRPPSTFIQVVEAREPGAPAGAPIEVAADSQGYFTIQGLQPGKHYQLTARARDGDRVLAGSSWATPPDPKVFIRISEDFATASTPALPGAPAWQGNTASGGQPPPPTPVGPDRRATPEQGWTPGAGTQGPGSAPAGPRRSAELGPPIAASQAPATQAPPPPAPQPVVNHPENVVNRDAVAQGKPIPLDIRGPSDPSDPLLAAGPARLPSCVLTGQTLQNFALLDLNGQPWEYRRNRRGRLTLIDFWGTWCVHCLHAVPHLNIFQQRYGPYGLEVIGIAYEEGTLAEQVQKVNRVRQRLQMNYRVLLGSDRNQCPVRTQFAVANWPTLVLLDERGRIIWRSEGLEATQIKELEVVIRQQLGLK